MLLQAAPVGLWGWVVGPQGWPGEVRGLRGVPPRVAGGLQCLPACPAACPAAREWHGWAAVGMACWDQQWWLCLSSVFCQPQESFIALNPHETPPPTVQELRASLTLVTVHFTHMCEVPGCPVASQQANAILPPSVLQRTVSMRGAALMSSAYAEQPSPHGMHKAFCHTINIAVPHCKACVWLLVHSMAMARLPGSLTAPDTPL